MSAQPVPDPQHSAAFARARADNPVVIDKLGRALDIVIGSADDVVELMVLCTDAAVGMIDGAHHAGVTASLGGTPFTVAPTDPAVETFDRQQYITGDGPCLRALHTAATVRVSVDELDSRWPDLGTIARAADLTDFLATALFAADVPAGSLNLYSHTAIPDTIEVEDVVTILADYLSRALTRLESITRHKYAAAALRDAVAARTAIERAIGVLMGTYRIDAASARARLTAEARMKSISLAEHARKILAALDSS